MNDSSRSPASAMLLRICLFCFGAILVLTFLAVVVPHPSWLGSVYWWAMIAATGCVIVSGLAMLVTCLLRPRIFVSEWMVILVLSGMPCAMIMRIALDYFEANALPDALLFGFSGAVMLIMNIAGALWGIHLCNRMAVTDAKRRMMFAGLGWVLVTATIYLPLGAIIQHQYYQVEPGPVWFGFILFANNAGIVTAWRVERRIKVIEAARSKGC
jgi:hypothetical protein